MELYAWFDIVKEVPFVLKMQLNNKSSPSQIHSRQPATSFLLKKYHSIKPRGSLNANNHQRSFLDMTALNLIYQQLHDYV